MLQLDGENLEYGQHLPTQKNDGDDNHHDGNGLSEIQAVAVGLEAASDQAENIKRGKAENQRPKDVEDVPFFGEVRQQKQGEELEAEGMAEPSQGCGDGSQQRGQGNGHGCGV